MSIFHLSRATATTYLQFCARKAAKCWKVFRRYSVCLRTWPSSEASRSRCVLHFTSGEPLYPATRAKIEKAFACRIFDSYGMTEYCGGIHECEAGEMHLLPEYGYLEILDEDDQPVAEGEEGYLAVDWPPESRHAADPLSHRRSRPVALERTLHVRPIVSARGAHHHARKRNSALPRWPRVFAARAEPVAEAIHRAAFLPVRARQARARDCARGRKRRARRRRNDANSQRAADAARRHDARHRRNCGRAVYAAWRKNAALSRNQVAQ